MQRTQPQALTTKELLALAYAMQYEVAPMYVRELCERLAVTTDALTMSSAEIVKPHEIDPRQLELPL